MYINEKPNNKTKRATSSRQPLFFVDENNLIDNRIVANLENEFETWNDKMEKVKRLVTTSPQAIKEGDI